MKYKKEKKKKKLLVMFSGGQNRSTEMTGKKYLKTLILKLKFDTKKIFIFYPFKIIS